MFVLDKLPVLDLLFPAVAVSLGPLAAAQFHDRRVAVPRQSVGLALVLALLVDDDLLVALAAAGEGNAGSRQENKELSHDFCAGAAGGLAPGLPGPYAVP